MLGSKQGSGWEELKEDESFLCGFVQLDIAKIRELKGSRVKLKKTKENFAEFVRAILTSHGHASSGRVTGGLHFPNSRDAIDYDNMHARVFGD